MEMVKYYNKIIDVFKKYEIDDLKIVEDKDQTKLVLSIDPEDNVQGYDINITLLDDYYLSLSTSFKLRELDKKDYNKLLRMINKFNSESFLKFIITSKYLVINYNMPEIDYEDVNIVVKIVTIIPNLFYQFYDEIKEYLL